MCLPEIAQNPRIRHMNWFLNTDRAWKSAAPARAFGHVGNGTNLVYVDPDNDLVAVVRWINGNDNEFLKRLLAAVKDRGL